MPRKATTIPVAELDATAVRVARRRRGPVLITENGRASAVLLGIDAFKRVAEERERLLALARGEREIRDGRGSSLERVLADLDKVLHRRRR